jgi:hypothetical protein
MSEFYAIITNFGNAPKASARLDVSVDTSVATGPVDVLFNVYSATGAQLAEYTVTTNANGYASSSAVATNDLFKLSGGAPALVRARTPDNAVSSAAILHQTGPGNRIDVAVAPTNRRSDGKNLAQGTQFSIAIGPDVPSPSLLIANVSGSDCAVDIFRGTRGSANGGTQTNPKIATNALWRVDLTDADKGSNIVVASTGIVIVQLALDDGSRVSALTCLPAL